MIHYTRQIEIKASPEVVFSTIETMPNKFPIYKVFETKPFLFVRILLVDGLRTAMKTVSLDKSDYPTILNISDSMGPFTLTELEKSEKYYFTLKSFFFNCQTGFSLKDNDTNTTLNLDIIAENPSAKERIWWFLVKPFHTLFANKVLQVIKERVESLGNQ